MWIELMFRDLKGGGWEWERSRVWNPDRANRLWLALAYAWMAGLGAAAFSSDKAVKEVAGGRSRAARSALFRLGVDVFRLRLERGRRVVCSLLFPSDLGRAAKSVVQSAHEGRGDPPAAIWAWFRVADLVCLSPHPQVPVSARTTNFETCPRKPVKGEGAAGFGRWRLFRLRGRARTACR